MATTGLPPQYRSATPVESGLEVVPEPSHLPEVTSYYGKPSPSEKGGVAAAAAPVEKRKFCGLRTSTFILLVLLILVIVIAAVAGGVGGSIAVDKAYERGRADVMAERITSSPDNSSPTNSDDDDDDSSSGATPATGGNIALPATIGLVPVDCPNLDSTTHKVTPTSKTFTFEATCGADSAPGEGDRNIITILAYRFTDCLRACASFNERGNVPNTTCGAVHFHSDLKWINERGGNCWLKKSVTGLVVDTNAENKNLHVFAVLQD